MVLNDGRLLLIVDGRCVLCSRSVRFIIRRDPEERFLFADRESECAQNILRTYGLHRPESVVLIAGEHAYLKSGAAIEILSRLRGFRWAATLLQCIPEGIRERFYDRVARNRYRWFGRETACYHPDDACRHRFLSREACEQLLINPREAP